MRDKITSNELQRLLADWCNGALSREDAPRLDAALRDDPEARRLYLQYASVEAELRSLHAGGAWVSENLQQTIVESHPGPAHDESLLVTTPSNETSGDRQSSARTFARFAIVASLVGIAAVLGWVGAKTGSFESVAETTDSHSDIADNAQRSANAVVARVTATRNCRWSSDSTSIGYGAELVAGQTLQLSAGLAELTFDSGARVLLEGPAELHLSADAEAVLHAGRLSATLPHGVEYTPVRTERMGVVITQGGELAQEFEKGWHFGLSADSHRGEEVHVFRGSVDAYLMPASFQEPNTRRPTVRLRPREAARIRPASTTVAKFFADRDKFVRSISSTGGPQDGLYAYEAFDYPPGPLSNQNGGFGWAGAWADIEAACPPGQLATNLVAVGGLPNAAVRGVGGHAAQVAQQNRIRRALGTSLGGVFDSAELVENQDSQRLVGASGQVVYISFLQRVDHTDDGFYGLELHRGDGNANRVLCVGNGAEGAGYGVTSNYNSYGNTNFGRLGDENHDTNLIVIKIEYGSEHRDLVTVYRNPESLVSEGVAQATARMRGNFAFDRVSLGCFDGRKRHLVDELRIGTTYRAVTGGRGLPPASLAMRVAEGRLHHDPLFAQTADIAFATPIEIREASTHSNTFIVPELPTTDSGSASLYYRGY